MPQGKFEMKKNLFLKFELDLFFNFEKIWP
jgi:hypothetical protein